MVDPELERPRSARWAQQGPSPHHLFLSSSHGLQGLGEGWLVQGSWGTLQAAQGCVHKSWAASEAAWA